MNPTTEFFLQLALSVYIFDWALLQLFGVSRFIVNFLKGSKRENLVKLPSGMLDDIYARAAFEGVTVEKYLEIILDESIYGAQV